MLFEAPKRKSGSSDRQRRVAQRIHTLTLAYCDILGENLCRWRVTSTTRLAALKEEFNIFHLTLEIRAPYCLEGAARPAQEGVSWITWITLDNQIAGSQPSSGV